MNDQTNERKKNNCHVIPAIHEQLVDEDEPIGDVELPPHAIAEVLPNGQ
jgi:hypothetical protein